MLTPINTAISILTEPPGPQRLKLLEIAIERRQKNNPSKAATDLILASQFDFALIGKLLINLGMLDLTNRCLMASLWDVTITVQNQGLEGN